MTGFENGEHPDSSAALPAVSPAQPIPSVALVPTRELPGYPPFRAGNGTPPRVLTQQMPTMTMLLKGLRRCWLLAAIVGPILAAAAGLATWFFLPLPKESARALVYVPEENPYVLFPDRAARHDYFGFKKTQATLVKSRPVLNRALRDPKIASLSIVRSKSDPLSWLDKDLKVDYSAGPEILTVSLAGDNEQETVELVNAIVSAYLSEFGQKQDDSRSYRIGELKTLQVNYSTKLRDRRKVLTDLVETTGTKDSGNLALRQRIALETLAAAQKDMTQLQSDIRKLQVDISLHVERGSWFWSQETDRSLANEPIPDIYFNEALNKDLQIAKYTKRIADLQEVIDNTNRINPDRGEALTKAERSEIETTKKAMEARRETLRPTLEAQIRERLRGEMKLRQQQKVARLEYLNSLQSRLDEDLKRLDNETRKMSKNSLDLENIQEDIAESNEILKKIGLELETMSVEGKAPPRIRPLEEAIMTHPDRRKIQIAAASIASLGVLAAVFLGLGWWEYRSLRIDSADQLTRDLGVPVMGTLPLLPASRRAAGFGSAAASQEQWSYLMIESVDSLRTILLHVARSESLRVVMITSAMEGEGKTSLSSQLATSLARSGRNTLLLDGDLRQPSLHRVFELTEPRGLCEVLRGEANVAEVIQPTALPGLSVIAGGACDDAALGALARGDTTKLLAELRGRYDFILVDSAPVLSIADSLLIAQAADGVLFSIMQDVSRLGPVYVACERLASIGVRILGAVMTAAADVKLYGRTSRYLSRGTPSDNTLVTAVREAP